MASAVEQTGRIAIKVATKASRTAVLGWHDGRLKIAVTAPPERGKANAAVIALLAKSLHLPKSAVEIVAGHTRSEKELRLHGLATGEARERLGWRP